eukprot:COSAG01_NODE_3214_length_6407_cov_5.475428_3_plen_126_part_00
MLRCLMVGGCAEGSTPVDGRAVFRACIVPGRTAASVAGRRPALLGPRGRRARADSRRSIAEAALLMSAERRMPEAAAPAQAAASLSVDSASASAGAGVVPVPRASPRGLCLPPRPTALAYMQYRG